jgi:hypothetical protein
VAATVAQAVIGDDGAHLKPPVRRLTAGNALSVFFMVG